MQRNQAAYAALVADAAGVITGVDAEPGMVVAAGTPVLRLAHDGPRDVVFAVPEDKVAAVRALAGAPRRVEGAALGRRRRRVAPATVREIAAAADPMTRTFLVKADIGAAADAAARPDRDRAARAPRRGRRHQAAADGGDAGAGQDARSGCVDPATMTVQPQPVEVAGADGNDVVVVGRSERRADRSSPPASTC